MGKCKIPVRFWIGVMIFFTSYINYTIVVNMSISIMSMTNTMEEKIPECMKKQYKTQRPELPDQGPRYDWSEEIQGQILGSFFLGHIVSSVFGGILAEYFGSFHVIFWSNVGCLIFNTLTVFAATWHYIAVCAVRFITGVFQGFVYPALQTMIARWAPPEEKGKFLGGLMGNTLSTALTWPLLGTIISAWGWPVGFHIISIQIGIFCIVFYIVCADSPDDHKFISEEERAYITRSQGNSVTKKKHLPPIRKMLSNIPTWVLIISFFGNLWGLFLQLQAIPKFMSEVIGYELKEAGFVIALPHIARLIVGIGIGFFEDYVEIHGFMSANTVRKFFTIFSHIIPGILLAAIPLSGCNAFPIIVLLTLSMGINGTAAITCMQNPQDLAPNFAGTIYGLMHLIGGTAGFLAPALTGYTVRDRVKWSEGMGC